MNPSTEAAVLPGRVPVLIVGAGISGLAAGRRLHEAGREFTILDKGRGVGGRCATRRFQGRRFDHGAQFFTVRDAAFRTLVGQWLDRGIVKEWCRGFPEQDGTQRDDGPPRYVAVEGMNRIPKALAADLAVHVQTKAVKAERTGRAWHVLTDGGETVVADRLVLTSPLPQSLSLLPAQTHAQLLAEFPRFREVRYENCFAVMLVLSGASRVPLPGGLRLAGPSIAWIADNTMKGINQGESALTVHTTSAFAAEHGETPHEKVADMIVAEAGPWLNSAVTDWQVHRWLYSKPCGFAGAPCAYLGTPPHLVLCGDCMQAPSRLEGAFLSGVAAAEALLDPSGNPK